MIDKKLRTVLLDGFRAKIVSTTETPLDVTPGEDYVPPCLTGATLSVPPAGPPVPPVALQMAAMVAICGVPYAKWFPEGRPTTPYDSGRKPCKFCGKETGHKKQLCSPECHKAYKAKWAPDNSERSS